MRRLSTLHKQLTNYNGVSVCLRTNFGNRRHVSSQTLSIYKLSTRSFEQTSGVALVGLPLHRHSTLLKLTQHTAIKATGVGVDSPNRRGFGTTATTSPHNSKTPTSVYRKAVENNELKPNPMQEVAIQRFQQLYDNIISRPPRSEAPIKPVAKSDNDLGSSAIGTFKSLFGGIVNKSNAFKSLAQQTENPKNQAVTLAPPSIKGLYVYGGVGCGKTMMMDMFFESLPNSIPKVRKHFHSFMLEIHAKLHKLRQEEKKAGREQSRDPLQTIAREFVQNEGNVLCLDEFQVTDVADAMVLRELFTGLFANGCVVIATSNRVPEDLYFNGINRESFLPFIPLLRQYCDVLPLENLPDYRMQVTAEQGAFHYPLNEQTKAAADSIFAALGAGGQLVSMKLDVMMGRTVNVPSAVAKRVARFTFNELCGQALGAADYIAIAQNFPCVILTDIPLLYFDERERIRRFITLLDVFYEHRTRLIMTAEAKPQDLFRPARSAYTGGGNAPAASKEAHGNNAVKQAFSEDEVFASSRAISRLVEMTSTNYLQASAKHGGSKDTPTSV